LHQVPGGDFRRAEVARPDNRDRHDVPISARRPRR
jgi:hypothetical protein